MRLSCSIFFLLLFCLAPWARAVDFGQLSHDPDILALATQIDSAEGSHKIYCSAVLVHPQIVLTAAHCLRDGNRVESGRERRERLKFTKIYTGDKSLDGLVSDDLVDIDSFHIHPRYLRDIRGLADIAVIKLKSPLTHLSAAIRPIATDYELLKSIKKGSDVEIVGLGFSEQRIGRSVRTEATFGVKRSGVLKVEGKTSSEVLVLPGEPIDRFGLFKVAPRDGDSGGPLFYKYKGKSFLLGIVSRASRFNHGPQGTAFSNIRHWICWIENVSQLRLRSDDAPDYCAPDSSSNALTLRDLCLNPSTSESYSLYVLKRTLGANDCFDLEKSAQHLTNLSLDASYLKNINVLRFFPKLQRLILRDNSITDLSALSFLKDLSLIDISYNNIRNISGIDARFWIVGAQRQYNNIARTQFIRMCQDANVQGEARRTINAILDMFSLPMDACVDGNYELIRRRELTLFAPLDLTDLTPLSSLHTLESLNISGQKVTDFSFLEGLKDLRSLNLSRIPLKDLNSIENLKNLNYLYLMQSSLTNIEFVSSLPRLRELHIAGNQISDFSPLFQHSSTLRVFGRDQQDF